MDESSQICNKAIDMLEERGLINKSFGTAASLEEYREAKVQRISTGSKGLDSILCGGVETGAVTEFYGGPGTGKTQICHSLAATVSQDKSTGGIGGDAIFIDTENSFRPERIRSISEARGYDPLLTLNRIQVATVHSAAHQEAIVKQALSLIGQANRGIKLLIIDSVISHYRAEYNGRAMLSERQYRINKLMHLLLRAANIHNNAVVVTNQIQTTPDANAWDPSKSTGGNVMSHSTNYRIFLRGVAMWYLAKIAGSPYHPLRDARFLITSEGITDITN
jgi:DNA repair protein RadA